MTEGLLFVGGPWNGRVERVFKTAKEWRVPYRQTNIWDDLERYPPESITLETLTYRRQTLELFTENSLSTLATRDVMVLESIDPKNTSRHVRAILFNKFMKGELLA